MLIELCVFLYIQDFSADFSDLDGVVRQRRQDMLDTSSSGSQTPDYEKMAGVYHHITFSLYFIQPLLVFLSRLSCSVVTLMSAHE